MTKPLFLSVALLTLAACGGGAAYQCPDYCADHNACAGATSVSCDIGCQNIFALNVSANCAAVFDSFVKCIGEHSTLVCDVGGSTALAACEAETTTYLTCTDTYCQSHSDPKCNSYHNLTGIPL
jgi:hypothetical protein